MAFVLGVFYLSNMLMILKIIMLGVWFSTRCTICLQTTLESVQEPTWVSV